jgi:hypothetical protein
MNAPQVVQEWKDPLARRNPGRPHPAGVMTLDAPVYGAMTISTPSGCCTAYGQSGWDADEPN